MTQDFLPWHLPEYEALRKLDRSIFEWPGDAGARLGNEFYSALESRSRRLERASEPARMRLFRRGVCARRLLAAASSSKKIAARLESLVSGCQRLSDEMSFRMLVHEGRNLLSIGYDVPAAKLNESCYDLLASEARAATFIAVAKGEAPQETWFRLGRQHTVCEKEKRIDLLDRHYVRIPDAGHLAQVSSQYSARSRGTFGCARATGLWGQPGCSVGHLGSGL